jgi:hypothetical protein
MSSKNAGSFIFQNFSVNVTCQPLYALVKQPAESYRQSQISELTVPKISNGC